MQTKTTQFQMDTSKKSYHLRANDDAEATNWIKLIRDAQSSLPKRADSIWNSNNLKKNKIIIIIIIIIQQQQQIKMKIKYQSIIMITITVTIIKMMIMQQIQRNLKLNVSLLLQL